VANFQQLRDELRTLREKLRQAEEDLLELRRTLATLEQTLEQYRRRAAGTPADTALIEQMKQKIEGVQQERDNKRAELKDIRQKIAQLHEEFKLFADPRTGVKELSDQIPCLLLPLRLETRFKKITQGAVTHDELWVRLYPDDCLIDTFDAALSEIEIRSAQRYWQERWRAGGDEAGERAAWRALVSSHGSGRAEWIERTYKPLNIAQAPIKNAANDFFLVIGTDTPLVGIEEMSTIKLWLALWLAERNLAQEQLALTQFEHDVGAARAQVILNEYRPYNLVDPPPAGFKRNETNAMVKTVVFPKNVATKPQSWSRAPRANWLPNRFVLLGYQGGVETLNEISEPVLTPLVVGPDPLAPVAEQLKPNSAGGLDVPDDMKWLVDFKRALSIGMAFRVQLSPAQAANGFDQFMVLGVYLEADEKEGQKQLETLLQHNHYGRSGLALIPQGTPTNNLEGQGAGFTSFDDPDASFDRLFQPAKGLGSSPDALKKGDGFWLCEWLGIDPKPLATVPNFRGSDQRDARALNRLLWPTTGDYFFRTMLHPMFSDETLEHLRWYFTHFVSGRGMIPALRIGRQPYGILATTNVAKIGWLDSAPIASNRLAFLKQLYPVLQEFDGIWTKLAEQVSHVGDSGSDPHQTLLNILGLHPTAAEYHFRFATNLSHLFNINQFGGVGASFLTWPVLTNYLKRLRDQLHKLGATTVDDPDLLSQFFTERQGKLFGPLVGTPQHSETEPLDPLEPGGSNYLEWLHQVALGKLDVLRLEVDFPNDQPPKALLYLLLRHALLLEYHHTAYLLFQQAHQNNPNLFTDAQLAEMKREPHFVHLTRSPPPNVIRSESRWAPLYVHEPVITGDPNRAVGHHITFLLNTNNPAFVLQRPLLATLRAQLNALEVLAPVPTAALERVLVEHLDCCSYRFDAWQLGLANAQLTQMRYQQVEDKYSVVQRGIYLGAYAYVENLRSDNKVLAEVTDLDPELQTVFVKETPLVRDNTNGGYVHAPSLNQAVTAAVLRNGYLSRATPANHETLQVNLSSNRIRVALQFMEGIRQGQSLGALLGYQLERGLHDRTTVPGLDELIYDFRKQFPLRSNQLAATRDPAAPIEQLEARNVIDGLKLIEQIRKSGQDKYPFDLPVTPAPVLVPDHLPTLTPDQDKAVNAEVERLLDIHDSLSDLAIAEAVHHATQGNFERASATLETFSQGKHPPEPSVIQTPTTGVTLTHRVGLHFKSGVQAPLTNATPRSQAAPGVNDWLTTLLPPLATISCKVTGVNPITGTDLTPIVVPFAALKLQPLDLLHLVSADVQQAMSELDERIFAHLTATQNLRPDTKLTIQYMQADTGHLALAEVAPLIRTARTLWQQSRPLRADDLLLPNEAKDNLFVLTSSNAERLTTVLSLLPAVQNAVTTLLGALQTLLTDPVANRAAILGGIDGFISQTCTVLQQAADYGVLQASWGFALKWKQDRYIELIDQTGKHVERWTKRLTQFNTFMAQYHALAAANTAERFARLLDAEREVSTNLTPRPETPELLEPFVVQKGTLFSQKRDAFAAVLTTTTTSLASLYASLTVLLPTTGEDAEPFDLAKYEKAVVLFLDEMVGVLNVVQADLARRVTSANEHFNAHASTADPTVQIKELQLTAEALFGADFRIVPEFTLLPELGNEWKNAFAAGQLGKLLEYLTTNPDDALRTEFPVDDWLYGVARVRQPMRLWEQLVMYTGALGLDEPNLIPVQFPFQHDDHWLALNYPPKYQLNGDRVLYTAHYPVSFEPLQAQCGLLLDEWAEVLLTADPQTGNSIHEMGISFHYDRPNNEAPQSWLLVTPANWNGKWDWDELVGAIQQTFHLAKKRAVEPQHLDATPLAHFLPAILLAATRTGISLSTFIADNNPKFKL
jgi:hypothetical protein